VAIPTRSDWGEIPANDLDARDAFRSFFGKSFAEAEALFAKNALYYQEELQAMPAIPFNFYAPAFAQYVVSDRARNDSDGGSSYLDLVIWILQTRSQEVAAETKEMLVRAAEQVASNQDFYDADVDIYGRFSDLWARIRALVRDDVA
jgi:hypothetical protein